MKMSFFNAILLREMEKCIKSDCQWLTNSPSTLPSHLPLLKKKKRIIENGCCVIEVSEELLGVLKVLVKVCYVCEVSEECLRV